MASAESNAIGLVELECTPAGLSIGLFGVGAFQEGYAPGLPTHGTRFCLPYSDVTLAHAAGDQLLLQLNHPAFPHQRLTLSRFTAGPGVPPLELRRRRLVLHASALFLAALATLSASMLVPAQRTESIAWGALGYGAAAALIVLALGYSVDQHLLLRTPGEVRAREAFVGDLAAYVPALRRSDQPVARPPKMHLPRLAAWMPRTAAGIGLIVAATVLTALVSGQRLLDREQGRRLVAQAESPTPLTDEERAPSTIQNTAPPPQDRPLEPEPPPPPPDATDGATSASVERRCLCDRADSPLWRDPIPKLSALLIEKRTVPRKSYLRLRLEVAVINNGDAPVSEITLHVQFYERDGKQRRHTKERPLYFEGPLRPGQAIKWSTEARGTEFEIQVPDFGLLGADGQGSAPADAFAELLAANHRPVRLHAARMLSYLGDPRGREGALKLKDAMRAAEGPYLRRVLAATDDLRVCDLQRAEDGSVGACVFNAGDEEARDVGLQLGSLYGSLDVSHPLAHPPELLKQQKWKLPQSLPAQGGIFVRVRPPAGFFEQQAQEMEINVDRFDLLD